MVSGALRYSRSSSSGLKDRPEKTGWLFSPRTLDGAQESHLAQAGAGSFLEAQRQLSCMSMPISREVLLIVG